jgi:hypothetical protein
MALGLALRLIYVVVTKDHTLVGDEVETFKAGSSRMVIGSGRPLRTG